MSELWNVRNFLKTNNLAGFNLRLKQCVLENAGEDSKVFSNICRWKNLTLRN
jgi:hypothetical protein